MDAKKLIDILEDKVHIIASHDDHPVEVVLSQRLINLANELYNGPSWNSSQPGAAGPGPMTQTIPEQGGDYIATKQGMKKGYWKVMNIKTGDVVQSGITTKSVADGIAQKWSQGYYKPIRGETTIILDLDWKPKLGKLGLRFSGSQKQIDLMHQLTKEAGLPLPKGGGTLYVKKGEEYEKLRDVAIKYGVELGMGE